MFKVYVLCAVLCIACIVLSIKIILLHRAVDEVCAEMKEKLDTDTNTLISVSGTDRHIRRLAAELNIQLRRLRREHRRFQNGDRELKEAITNISHDLRTPLTAICGYLDLLEDEEKSKEATRYLSLIGNRTQALKQLTEELFRYSVITSTLEDIQLEAVSLNGILEESVAAYYAVLKERGIVPSIKIPEKRVLRQLNHAALSRVFSNILNNALKYSDGDLDIALSEEGEIIFTNTASGLDEVQVGKLFHRFYTVEAARNATGLGLSISRSLVEQMHGTITARYKENKLSVHVLFPDC